MYINRSTTDYIGLFGVNDGEVSNVGVVEAVITGGSRVGGLVGYNEGVVSNLYAMGDVSADGNVGGLVGENRGTVENSYAMVTVRGDLFWVGGLVGHNSEGRVSNSHATGNVSGPSDVGGLVGYNWMGTVSNSYATGSVSGKRNVGGLVGYNWIGTVSNSHAAGMVMCEVSRAGGLVGENYRGTMDNSYATGEVIGGNEVGGLVGFKIEGTVKDAYSTGNVSGDDRVGGLVGLNYEGLLENTYATGNLNGNSSVGGLIGYHARGKVTNSHYNIDKLLINGGQHVTLGGLFDGQYKEWFENDLYLDITYFNDTLISVGEYYEIICLDGIRDLLGFAGREGYKFRMVADLDFSTVSNLYIPYIEADFDGAGHIVSNIQLEMPFVTNLGLFGYLYGGNITNLGVTDAFVSGYDFVGSLVGENYRGTIENCYARGNVSGNLVVGGLIGGSVDSMVLNSYAKIDVSGNRMVGGFMGWNFEAIVSDSFATGNVHGESQVGGFLGENFHNATVLNSYSTCNVIGDSIMGGLVGQNTGTVLNSYAIGNVSGFESVGGLVGFNEGQHGIGRIIQSYATCDVNGDSAVGGLVGTNHGVLFNTYATGNVNGNIRVGGLVGNLWGFYGGEIASSYAIGAVNGTRYLGGLVGYSDGWITSSFYDAYTTGQSDVGKGMPKTTYEMINITTFSDAGWDIVAVYDNDDRIVNYHWNILDTKTYPFFSWQEEVQKPTLYELTISSPKGGEVTSPGEWKFFYVPGFEVEVETLADEGWRFSYWSGDVTEGEVHNEELTILMDSNKTVVAHFERQEFSLNISVEGDGTTSPSPGVHPHLYEEEVNVTATSSEGWRFSHWSGDVESTDETVTIFMDGNKSITAHFEELLFIPDNLELLVTPVEGESPLNVTITVRGDNIGLLNGSVDVLINDAVVHTLLIPAEGSAEHTFNHTFQEPGNYTITFHNLSETVIVSEPDEVKSTAIEDNFTSLLIIAMIAVVILLVLFKKRMSENASQDIQESAPEDEIIHQTSDEPFNEDEVLSVEDEIHLEDDTDL